MRGKGYILQYSKSAKKGMIHLGGGARSSLVPFTLTNCHKTVHRELQRGEIPNGPPVEVAFEVALRDGGLFATNVHLAPPKSSTKKARAKATRKLSDKAATRPKRQSTT